MNIALRRLALTMIFVLPAATAAQESPGSSFKDVISLRNAGSPAISPDGSAVAYVVSAADWEKNRYDQEIWLVRDGGEPFQLTRTKDGSSDSPAWSPDGRWIAFTSDRDEKQQVYLIRAEGGEAWPLTSTEGGVSGFRWSPDSRRIAFSASETEGEAEKQRKESYGEFAVEDEEYRMTHLWVIDLPREGDEPTEPRRLTDGREFTVGGFEWSPDGTLIAFEHRPDPLINSWLETDISVLEVSSGDIRPLVNGPGPDLDPAWSPDGAWILFLEHTEDLGSLYYRNSELARIPAAGGAIEVLSESFDEDACCARWNQQGIFFIASQGTRRQLFRLDPERRAAAPVSEEPYALYSADFSADGRSVAVLGEGPNTLNEVYLSRVRPYRPRRLTRMTDQVAGWALGAPELIQWESEDGARIEGVLYKPDGYQAGRRYPLLVVIHGGPSATSRPELLTGYVYPVHQWLARGAVVLLPNYRGSAGYGGAFRALNVRNLGVGDMWDVMSGVEHLVQKGIAHPDSLGAMGWSQGGYISAFLTTHTDRFRAISVGAGISNWVTYYVNTDIHPFTRMYLKATPWEDRDIYATTSPMTTITSASTPTLIQHGEFDRRVPIPNAYELFQGLRDMGVESQLIVYKGFGHGINKPKERLAATWHNWIWFARHIWGEQVEMPLEEKEEVAANEP